MAGSLAHWVGHPLGYVRWGFEKVEDLFRLRLLSRLRCRLDAALPEVATTHWRLNKRVDGVWDPAEERCASPKKLQNSRGASLFCIVNCLH